MKIEEILDEFESLFEISEAPEHIINNFNNIKKYIVNIQQENQKKDAYIKYLEEYTPGYYEGKKFYGDGREELQKIINKARNRLLTDISLIKSMPSMCHEEILQRLENIDYILKGGNNERNIR